MIQRRRFAYVPRVRRKSFNTIKRYKIINTSEYNMRDDDDASINAAANNSYLYRTNLPPHGWH